MPGLSRFLSRSIAAAMALGILSGNAGSADRTRLVDYQDRLLAVHNAERAKLGIGPMDWDPTLALSAQRYANTLADTGRFEHYRPAPGQTGQGENLWRGPRGTFAPERMLKLWVDEKVQFTPGRFPATSKTGAVSDVSHYTQMVWRKTERVGCAIAADVKREVLVCRYAKPGNIIGQRVY